MRRLLIVFLLASVAACSRKGGGNVKLRTDVDSVAYILGMNIGANLVRMDSTLNLEAVCRGIRDAAAGDTRLTTAEAKAYYLRYMNYMLPEKALAYEEQFLADIAKSNRAYARTKTGVTYTVDEIGDQNPNAIPSSDRDTVSLRWIIRTADGAEVYSSYERGDTIRSAMSALRPGVRESVKLIGKGGRIDTWLPAKEAYGASGDAELGIGPNATLYYEIELVEVEKWNARLRNGV